MDSKARNWLIVGAGVIGVLCLCVVAAAAGGLLFLRANPASVIVPTPIVIVEQITVVVGPTQETVPTGAPAPTETEPVPAQEPTKSLPAVDFEGVHFTYDPTLARNIKAEIVEAPAGTDVPPWELLPRHLRFEFEGYPREGETFHHAEILVFPVAEYAQISEGAGPEIEKLKQALNERATKFENDNAPFLPGWNAAQMFHAQLRYLDNGLRYVTQYGQDVSPISNERAFYTYQGLAGDGKYYVAAIFPIRSPALPDTGEVDDYEAFANKYTAYMDETKAALEAEPAENFEPDLELLDTLVESIIVQ